MKIIYDIVVKLALLGLAFYVVILVILALNRRRY